MRRLFPVLLLAFLPACSDLLTSPRAEPLDRTSASADFQLPIACGEASCVAVTGLMYSHFTGSSCSGSEAFYLPNSQHIGGGRGSWDGKGIAGTLVRTLTVRSYRNTAGSCINAYPNGSTASDFVYIYRGSYCGDDYCLPPSGRTYSHFAQDGCTGQESFYTPNSAHVGGGKGTWDGQGYVGTTLRKLTVRSYRSAGGACFEYGADITSASFNYVYRSDPQPPPSNATINGPTYLWPYTNYTWTASVSGGAAPLRYIWYVDGSYVSMGADLTMSFDPYYQHEIRVDVTDALNRTATGWLTVAVNTGTCQPGELNCAEMTRVGPGRDSRLRAPRPSGRGGRVP